MANRYKIENHPQRKNIERDIVNGVPDSRIASNYVGISDNTVRRYRTRKMPQILRHEETRRAEGLLDRISEYLDNIDELFSATREWLADPDDPTKMCFAPHAEELLVVYTDMDSDRPKTRKAPLSELLKKTSVYVDGISFMGQDPRVTMIKTAEVLNKQLELLCRTQGLIQAQTNIDVNVNATTGNLDDIVAIARRALAPYPEALQAFVSELLKETEKE